MENIDKVYYIQKEEIEINTTTVFCPTFFKSYKNAKKEFIKFVKSEKDSFDYLLKEDKEIDFIKLYGYDSRGQVKKQIYLRSGNLNE